MTFSRFFVQLLMLISVASFISASIYPQEYLQESEKQRLSEFLKIPTKPTLENLASIYQAVSGLNVIHQANFNAAFESTQKKNEYCNVLKQFLSQTLTLEQTYYVTGSLKLLSCPFSISTNVLNTLTSVQKEGTSIVDLFRSASALLFSNSKLDTAKLARLLTVAWKKDESLTSAGPALQLSAYLGNPHLSAFLPKISYILAQAEETDGKSLKFEGGLGVTANIVSGFFALANAANKPIGLSAEQIIKFSNYFISRQTVQTTKGAAELLNILSILSDNKYHVPVVISTFGTPVVAKAKPVFTVKVTNVLGGSLARDFVIKLQEKDEITKTYTLQPVQGDSTLYALDLYSKNLAAGKHILIADVQSAKGEVRFILPKQVKFEVFIQDEIAIDSLEYAVGEKEQIALKYDTISFPKKLTTPVVADYTQKFGLKFNVKNVRTGNDVVAHQCFIIFRSKITGNEIVFVADYERSSATYRTTINLATRSKEFISGAGDYELFIVAGDSSAANAIKWNVGLVEFDLPQQEAPARQKPWLQQTFAPKPLIEHQFRQPEKRPAAIVSQTFTFLVLAPVLILLISWSRIGINLSNFRFQLSALLFHISLGLIFTLYTLFFFSLNMFTTIKCLSGVLALTFVSGHYLLSGLAKKSD